MKLNFKKISAVLTSGIMTVSGIGFAAAANYPDPFVVSGTANVAIVYGTGTGVSSLDIIQAGNIQSNLQSKMGAGTGASTGTTTGGDSVKLEKSSTKFQLGKGIGDVISTAITDDSPGDGLPVLLADGEYLDDDGDEQSYTQKIELINASANSDSSSGGVLRLFDDDDYKADTPTIGFRYSSSDHVLNYTLDFTDTPEWGDLDSTNIEIMGKDYFILSHTANTTINLLDAAQTTTLTEGESTTVTVEGTNYDVSIAFIGGTGSDAEVKLTVNGETTGSLGDSSASSNPQTRRLSDGAYVGIKDINVQDYAGGVKNVEFSIGSGKLVLKHGVDVEINDATISDLTTYITNTNGASDTEIDKIVIEWDAEDELFVTPDREETMPGFKAVKLSFAGMLYPTMEDITVKGGSTDYISLDNFPLKDSTEDIPILAGDSTGNFTVIGKDVTHQLKTSSGTTLVYDKDTDDWFIVSYNDGSDSESYLMRATSFGLISGSTTDNQTTIQYKKNGVWTDLKTDAKNGDVVSIGNVEMTLSSIDKSPVNDVTFTVSGNVEFNRLYSKEGMQVYIPINDTTVDGSTVSGAIEFRNASTASNTYSLIFSEEDKNGNLGEGNNITLTLGWNAATTPEAHVSGIAGETPNSGYEVGDTDHFISNVHSALATSLDWDKSGDQYEVTMTYHGDESYGEVWLTAPATTITGGTGGTSGTSTPLGEVLVKDTEVSSVSSKNLIIVGGSCINSAAATALGVSSRTCGAAFTTATGVGSGQFLIKGVSGAYTTGKIALVVAGYEAADTVNAAKYLTTQTVDTSKEYKGTSSTSATLVTTTT